MDLRIEKRFAQRAGAKLHYLRAGQGCELTPLVYLPGFGSDAETFRDEMKRLAPRLSLGVGKRGLGKSSVTESGYSLEAQAADLSAVVDHAEVTDFCLMAFSMGVPVALRYAAQSAGKLKGLILLDYRASYPEIPEAAVESMIEDGLPPAYAAGSQRESADISLWDELSAISCPVLIVRGGQSRALTRMEAERYQALLPHAKLVTFEDAGHEVYKPDYERFMLTIETFLEELD